MDKNNMKPYVFKHPEYEWRVLTAGGKTFFCDEVMVTDMVNLQKRGDQWQNPDHQ